MNSTAAASGGCRPPFTALQWQELEHQALIFKYLMAGVPVPPDLLLPIRRSFEAMAARFYQYPSLSYCSFYGKKLDPEPGRCRRTDGKKWRCSKDAYPDSKYCERHMNRGRNRSRKPVETHTSSQPQKSASPSSSSTVTSLTPTASGGNGSFHNANPLQSIASTHSHGSGSGSGTNPSQLQLNPGLYSGIGSKDYRYLQGVKSDVGEYSFFSEASGSVKGHGLDSSMDSAWCLMPSRVSSFPLPKGGNSLDLPNSYPQLQSLQDIGQETMDSMSRQQQHSFLGTEFGSAEQTKQESQSLRPFFDEWPKSRDSWFDLEDERSNRTSFSTTQLSISIPMASSDFSTTSSRSPNDD